jgi:DNA-binding transcriptional ArsR family regulator
MVAAANLVEVAALVGDTARATMLAALMGGQSLTGTELAYVARVSRPTASEHLARLVEARLLAVTRKRRFAYYRIASPLVAQMLESIKAVAAIEVPPRHQPRSAADEALRFARTCYDHIAGTLGVAIADALQAAGHVVISDDGGELTDRGARLLQRFGATPCRKRRAAASIAGRASIGASGATISRVSSAPRFAAAASSADGSPACAIPARCG